MSIAMGDWEHLKAERCSWDITGKNVPDEYSTAKARIANMSCGVILICASRRVGAGMVGIAIMQLPAHPP